MTVVAAPSAPEQSLAPSWHGEHEVLSVVGVGADVAQAAVDEPKAGSGPTRRLRRRHSDPRPESMPRTRWKVVVTAGVGGTVKREVSCSGSVWQPQEGATEWSPETTIWPAWSPSDSDLLDPPATPLDRVHDYWSGTTKRLRDSAKWMSTVVGAAIAVLAGTSPLTGLDSRIAIWSPQMWSGVAGLVLLGATLLQVLWVMRPVSVSFADVQLSADRSLRHWKRVVESQPDLYLPCGLLCLQDLRWAMIVEEVTMGAVMAAIQDAAAKGEDQDCLKRAQAARVARLRELRHAASQVALIGEYYRLKERSGWATYGGVICGVLGTMTLAFAFM